MKDRYGNPLSCASDAARDHYVRGIDLFLAAQPGAEAELKAAIEADPDFVLAHADLARIHQIQARPTEALACMDAAEAITRDLSACERGHLAITSFLVRGKPRDAFIAINEHLESYPRDVMCAQPCCGVFSLIGFSGRVGREAENLAFMARLERHYGDDWWFTSQYAFALSEVGQLDAAERYLSDSLAVRSDNANSVHHQAHLDYEYGRNGRAALDAWRESYSTDAILHCHLSWHSALWALAEGDVDQVWERINNDIHPEASAPPINVLTDLVAILLRLRLLGHEVPQPLWEKASAYASAHFVKPGVSFADAHAAAAHAIAGQSQPLRELRDTPKGTAADIVNATGNAFAAFVQEDWTTCANALLPIMVTHERLGGSRAQRDLLELVLAYALTQADRGASAQALLASRRPHLLHAV